MKIKALILLLATILSERHAAAWCSPDFPSCLVSCAAFGDADTSVIAFTVCRNARDGCIRICR